MLPIAREGPLRREKHSVLVGFSSRVMDTLTLRIYIHIYIVGDPVFKGIRSDLAPVDCAHSSRKFWVSAGLAR